MVPIRKNTILNSSKASQHVCGDYSTLVNSQLEIHQHPLPLPEDLIQTLGGDHGFTKLDLANAYNQIKLTPDSWKHLAIILLHKRLPLGISFAPAYFQKIIDNLTNDLPEVAIYLDDILVSGIDAGTSLQNLKHLLHRLHEKSIRFCQEKCQVTQPQVDYLGQIISNIGISKSPNVIITMPAPKDVPALHSFLGSVQFYGKVLPLEFSTIAASL